MLNYFIIKKQAYHNFQCPHCHSSNTVLYGRCGIKQRYLCRSCHRTYNDFTKTPFAYAHFPDKLTAFIECTLESMSLRESAQKLKVSYVTLFYWRHKLLAALKKLPENKMKAIVQIENFYLNFSRKGQKHVGSPKRVHGKAMSYFNFQSDKVCILAAVDSVKNICSKAVCIGFMSNRHIQNSVGKLLDSSNMVCSRRKGVYRMFLKRMHIKESKETLDNSSAVIKHIKSFIQWMKCFNGVASKYLNNYISLYKFLAMKSFSDISSGVKYMLDNIAAVNISETYKSITINELFFKDFID